MKRFAFLAATALTLAGAAPAFAQDAFATFDGTQGAGNFYYGQAAISNAANGGTFFQNGGPCAITGTICLQQTGNNVPGVYKSTGGAFQTGTVLVPDDRLILHTADGSADDLTFAAFVAPTAGVYRLFATFSVQDTNPSGVDLFSIGTTNGGTPLIFTPIGALSAANPTFSFATGPLTLGASEAFGFGVGNGGDFRFDSTGLSFQVVAGVPEPTSWAMMIGGVGMAGGALRRRKAGVSVRYA